MLVMRLRLCFLMWGRLWCLSSWLSEWLFLVEVLMCLLIMWGLIIVGCCMRWVWSSLFRLCRLILVY